MHGKGYLKYPNGAFYKGMKINTYLGDFKHNKMHGMGILKTNNEIYEGEFENGLKHGYGKINVNDFVLVGNWVKDVF